MSYSHPLFLSLLKLFLVLLAFLLQLTAVCTSWWAAFSARIDLGKPQENGHYGLWTLCSTKGPHWLEDCDPLDTFFELPSYSRVSGVIGVLHLLLLLTFLPFGSMKTFQIIKNLSDFCLNAKTLCIIEVSISVFSTILAILVAVFISIGENNNKEYSVVKGWSFWIQVCVIIIDLLVSSVAVHGCLRLWRLHTQQQVDPTGKRAETYGNPSFDADSPEMPRHRDPTNGTVAYTESSGHPYEQNVIAGKKTTEGDSHPNKRKKSGNNQKESVNVLTYENECYQESSPAARRAHTQRQR